MSYRDLETVRVIIKDSTGLDITYAYEDLVFPEHAAFIIQFDETNEQHLNCYFHSDCNTKDKEEIYKQLKETSAQKKFTIKNKGSFLLKQKGENVEISFA